MIVVADTSPLNCLIQVEAVVALPRLYSKILIPQEVFSELAHPGARNDVRAWVSALPNWVEIRKIASYPYELRRRLDAGEACAIQLAQEANINLLLVDDLQARKEAAALGLSTTGTLGVLVEAPRQHLVDGFDCLRRLRAEQTFIFRQYWNHVF